MTPKEILLGAAQNLRELGHCKGQFQNDAGCVCAVGAIRLAASGSVYHSNESATEATRILRRVVGHHGEFGTIPEWNDDPERTPEEVIAAFEKAAELAT
jgi:hypothetical protein